MIQQNFKVDKSSFETIYEGMCFAFWKVQCGLDAVATKKRRSEENVSVAALTCSPSCYEMKSIFLGFVFQNPRTWKDLEKDRHNYVLYSAWVSFGSSVLDEPEGRARGIGGSLSGCISLRL